MKSILLLFLIGFCLGGYIQQNQDYNTVYYDDTAVQSNSNKILKINSNMPVQSQKQTVSQTKTNGIVSSGNIINHGTRRRYSRRRWRNYNRNLRRNTYRNNNNYSNNNNYWIRSANTGKTKATKNYVNSKRYTKY